MAFNPDCSNTYYTFSIVTLHSSATLHKSFKVIYEEQNEFFDTISSALNKYRTVAKTYFKKDAGDLLRGISNLRGVVRAIPNGESRAACGCLICLKGLSELEVDEDGSNIDYGMIMFLPPDKEMIIYGEQCRNLSICFENFKNHDNYYKSGFDYVVYQCRRK